MGYPEEQGFRDVVFNMFTVFNHVYAATSLARVGRTPGAE
jgi:hypothetical protein